VEEVLLHRRILVQPRMGDFIPAGGVQPQRLSQAVRLTRRRCRRTASSGRDGDRGGMSGPCQCVREGLVLLLRRRGGGGWDGEVGAFEVGGGERGDVVPD